MDCRIRLCAAAQRCGITDSRTKEDGDLRIYPISPRAFQGSIQVSVRMSDLSDNADCARRPGVVEPPPQCPWIGCYRGLASDLFV